MKQKRGLWCWKMGVVNTSEEHIEIRYGSADDSGWDQWTPVALVSSPKQHTFTVQFLIEAQTLNESEMISAVKSELDFYLVEKSEKNPWIYVRYHCGTCANVYSKVHWSFFPKGWKSPTSGSKGRRDRRR